MVFIECFNVLGFVVLLFNSSSIVLLSYFGAKFLNVVARETGEFVSLTVQRLA